MSRLLLLSLFLAFVIPIVGCSQKEKGGKITPREGHDDPINGKPRSKGGREWGVANGFPQEWWPVPESAQEPWFTGEVFPHEAKAQEVIISYRTPLKILLPFSDKKVTLFTKSYASIEGFWQSLKYPEGPDDERNMIPDMVWPFARTQVEQLVWQDTFKAQKAADKNMEVLNIAWVTYRGTKYYPTSTTDNRFLELIRAATLAKVRQNADVKELLLSTKNLTLRTDFDSSKHHPVANFAQMLTEIRTSLQNEQP